MLRAHLLEHSLPQLLQELHMFDTVRTWRGSAALSCHGIPSKQGELLVVKFWEAWILPSKTKHEQVQLYSTFWSACSGTFPVFEKLLDHIYKYLYIFWYHPTQLILQSGIASCTAEHCWYPNGLSCDLPEVCLNLTETKILTITYLIWISNGFLNFQMDFINFQLLCLLPGFRLIQTQLEQTGANHANPACRRIAIYYERNLLGLKGLGWFGASMNMVYVHEIMSNRSQQMTMNATHKSQSINLSICQSINTWLYIHICM